MKTSGRRELEPELPYTAPPPFPYVNSQNAVFKDMEYMPSPKVGLPTARDFMNLYRCEILVLGQI